MRSLTAPALYVSLLIASLIAAAPEIARAGDWHTVHDEALEAVKRRDFPGAAGLLRQSASLASNFEQRGLSANDLGVVLHQIQQDTEAGVQLETAFHIWKTAGGQEVRLAETTEALAAVYRTLGDYKAAERFLRDVLKTPPAEENSYALMLNELGDILREVGQPNEAYTLLERTLSLKNISSRRRLDATLGLADLDRDAHRWQSSFDRWNSAAETAREQHWPALEASAVRGLGVTFLDHGEPARAEPLLRRAMAQFETSEAPRHQIASTLSCLAQLYLAENKLAMAEDALIRGIDISEKWLGPMHPQVAVLLEMLGDTVANRNQLAQARDYYGRAHIIMSARFGEQSPIAAAVDASWALVEHRAKHHNEAANDYEKALAVLDAAGPEVAPLRLTVHQHYAELCRTLHRKNLPAAQSLRPVSAATPSTGGQMPQSN